MSHSLDGIPVITSESNEKIKQIKSIMNKPGRNQDQLVLEGHRVILDSLKSFSGLQSSFILATADALTLSPLSNALRQELTRSNVPVHIISEKLVSKLSFLETSQGVLGIFDRLPQELPSNSSFVLLLDRVADPGNLGTLLR